MSKVKTAEFDFLSELYRDDAPDARLLAEYPSSNSTETQFQNQSKFIIHDPFPPPRRELIKVLGPHHLMCGWGRHVDVTSDIEPPTILLDHWRKIFGDAGCPNWVPFDPNANYITLFPHESLPPERQVVDPETNYALHSKEVIARIDCPQAEVLESIEPPCIVKLSHGYAGLGNFLVKDSSDEVAMREELAKHWPDAELVVNSIIEGITGDFGVQFYLHRDGSMVWIGLTEQLFDENNRWCGGKFSASQQTQLRDELCRIVEPVGAYLHGCGYFGLVGIDILRDLNNDFYLVDVNPRLTGVSPFLVASRLFTRDGLNEGIYQASCCFNGTYEQLITAAESKSNAKVVLLSAIEEQKNSSETKTTCHLSVTSNSQSTNQQVLVELLG